MNDARLELLIQRRLDGVATPEEEARLREELERSPEARARHQEILAVFDALGAARREPVPAGFREGVMHAVRSEAGARRIRPIGVRARLDRPALVRLALPFAAGFAAGVLIVTAITLQMSGARDARTVGTMGAPSGGGVPAGRTQTVGGALRAALRTDPAGLTLHLEAIKAVEVVVRPEAGDLEVTAFRTLEAPAAFHVSDGGCTVSLAAGSRAELAVHPESGATRSLRVETRGADGSVATATLSIQSPGAGP